MGRQVFRFFNLLALAVYFNACLAASVLPGNVEVSDFRNDGGWSLPTGRSEFVSPEMKVDIWMRGLGSTDVELSVSDFADGGLAGFSVDLDIFNLFPTPIAWSSFAIALGTGVGANFVESSELDDLFFDVTKRTEDENGSFASPPIMDDGGIRPDRIEWSDGLLRSAETSTSVSSFTFFAVVPDLLDGVVDGRTTFSLQIRGSEEVAVVPIPASFFPLASALFLVHLVARLKRCRRGPYDAS